MTTTTRKRSAGFYGNDVSTYCVTKSGQVWVVQTDDLRDCPFQVAEVPADAIEVDDLLTFEEIESYSATIEAQS